MDHWLPSPESTPATRHPPRASVAALSSDRPSPDRVSQALAFLRRVHEDGALAARVDELDPADGLEPLVAIAADAGFTVSAEDMRRAYRLDWNLRRARYS
jgi:predicted ribosomally synthesized peptide with nif11-like leader